MSSHQYFLTSRNVTRKMGNAPVDAMSSEEWPAQYRERRTTGEIARLYFHSDEDFTAYENEKFEMRYVLCAVFDDLTMEFYCSNLKEFNKYKKLILMVKYFQPWNDKVLLVGKRKLTIQGKPYCVKQ